MKIICLDIDNCILPSFNVMTGYKDENRQIDTLKLNIKALETLINTTGAKIFLTSSWSQYLYSVDDKGKKDFRVDMNSISCQINSALIHKCFFQMKNILKETVGISRGDRIREISNMQMQNHKIVVFDNRFLGDLKNDNTLIFKIEDYIPNKALLEAQTFLGVKK